MVVSLRHYPEELLRHKVLHLVVVPDAQKDGCKADEHTLQTTDVSQPIKECVAISADFYLVEIHLHRQVYLSKVVSFIRHDRLLIKGEDRFIGDLCHFIQVQG